MYYNGKQLNLKTQKTTFKTVITKLVALALRKTAFINLLQLASH
jgi:hypothetical protein